MMKKSATIFLFLAVTFPSLASSAKVTRILDGDTIEVQTLSENMAVTEIPVRVRLNGVDAPEKQQPYGQRSKQFLADMIGGKQVTMVIDGRDRYNRILGDIFIKQCTTKCEAVSVNTAMVKAGMAWAYRYHNVAVNPHMAALEATARSEGLGLWQDKKPVEPWKWRQEHQ